MCERKSAWFRGVIPPQTFVISDGTEIYFGRVLNEGRSRVDNAGPATVAIQNIHPTDEELFSVLGVNYECLRRCCRLGKFEHTVMSIADCHISDGTVFYTFRLDAAIGRSVPFIEAVNNCYQLLRYVSKKDSAEQHGILLLRVKSVIYEAGDYWLSVSAELADEFIARAESFNSAGLTTEAEQLNGEPFATIDERTRVVKDLIIAALFGANQLYRRHDAISYDTARKVLNEICRYIDSELPLQHQERRASYGLEGMAHYLRGRILSAQGSFSDARKEFRKSAEAYLARLRQKERYVKLGKISIAVFEEKRAVTVRRAALVSAFGDGHISFVSSRITRALEIMTLARAVLTQDSIRLYVLYVDVLYWSCQRAVHSSDETKLNEIIDNMTACRDEICSVLADSHYSHRAGLELALTLYYRTKIAYQNADLQNCDRYYLHGVELLDSAIDFAREHKNPHLHADALIIRSHFLRLSFRLHTTKVAAKQDRALSILEQALEDAEEAVGLSASLPALVSDAFIARGAVESMLAEFYGEGEEFRHQFNKARGSFNLALNRKGDENVRLEAEAHLRLAKLSLLDAQSHFLAYSHFKRWEEVRDCVEHEYCHAMARKIWSQIHQEGPTLILRARDILDHKDVNEVVKKFSIDATLFELVTQHAGNSHLYDDQRWKKLLKEALSSKLGYHKTQISELIKDLKLIDKVKEMCGPLPSD